ncbi:HEAT repeat domain-containing protein [Streptomyces scopuliridis]|uniref:HEAT repeat domain-containing protein n=1 Tax=Streptomyces scopuliridis TaxID=452529 RepID=UPI0036A23849
MGDGGAGPAYGLLTLADTYDTVSDSFAGHLLEPSPFVPDTLYAEGWWDGFWGPDDRPDPLQGTLAMVHHGCTGYTQLVVTGPGRGRIVNVDLNGVPAPYVLEDPDFLSWYERWLDELLAGYHVTWFGEKIPGDEAALLRVLAGDPSPQRRARAARSLGFLPRITPTAAGALTSAAADADPLVRRAALEVAWRSKAAAVEPAARSALTDPDAAVRAEAISVLRALGTADAGGAGPAAARGSGRGGGVAGDAGRGRQRADERRRSGPAHHGVGRRCARECPYARSRRVLPRQGARRGGRAAGHGPRRRGPEGAPPGGAERRTAG